MSDFNQFHDDPYKAPEPSSEKMPDMINILTILTFVGCSITLIRSCYNYFTVCRSITSLEQSADKMASNKFLAGIMDSVLQAAHRQCEMRLPLLLSELVCLVLCFVGALQMRKLKKSGFYIYLIGELGAPAVALALVPSLMGGLSLFTFLFPLIFVILYASQLKHMR